ncbi:Tripartite tricarboxylate transporter family receptor [Pigmentiphaga humi]|uniref:Tripartite tricarboxylate transporter family receptor n=1 Tax=Pigmentiphaga humi TaxID=2478468 RepID=A0A3P4B6V5_9BURK|nr:tripartite tricarboxylate transporter substrate binding protein [Pigmentiphaga humi]VCU71651.1 Tripartite tricarboxylate transporter family receptor [Pigmentiphaga humi]
MNFLHKLLCSAALGAAFATPAAGLAQSYPTRPIKLVVPWPAGGPSDFVARAVAEGMREDLGQTIVVENKPGATGRIGTEAVRLAPPDGYTLVLAISNTHGVAPALYPKLPYDPVRDFTAVGVAAIGPLALAVRSTLPIKTMAELIDYAKRNPGKLNFASAGPGSGSHLMGEMLKAMAGIDIVHVPFKGTAPAVNDLVAGHVDLIFEGLAIKPYVTEGKLSVLATTGSARWFAYPDAPTTTEAGFPKLQSASWFGLMGPRDMPPAIVARLNRSLLVALKSPAVQAAFKSQGMDAAKATSPSEMDAFIADEIARWKENLALINYTQTE